MDEILKGFKNQKVMANNNHKLEIHGKLFNYNKNEIEKLIRHLIFLGHLKEEVEFIKDNTVC